MELDFGDFKKNKKTLLIASFIGIVFKSLVFNSTGDIQLLGFKIPVENANIIPKYIGYLIIYLIVALVVRFFENRLNELKLHLKENNIIDDYKKLNLAFSLGKNSPIVDNSRLELLLAIRKIEKKMKVVTRSVIILDLIFPILLGLFALYTVFSNGTNNYINSDKKNIIVSNKKIDSLEIELSKCDEMLKITEYQHKINVTEKNKNIISNK